MKYDEKNNEYELSTGKRFYANDGILGLGVGGGGEGGSMFNGYDGTCEYWYETVFTREERHEIATEMIHRWMKWSITKREERKEKGDA